MRNGCATQLAHGAVRLITRSKEYELTDPELVTDLHRQHVPAVGRGIMRFMRVTQFLDFQRAGEGPARGGLRALRGRSPRPDASERVQEKTDRCACSSAS